MSDLPVKNSVLYRLRDHAVARLFGGLESLVLLFSTSGGGKKNVILIRLDAIGDFILWLDAAKEYRRLYPDKRITLLANSIWAELAERLRYWDEVWPIDMAQLRRHSFYRLRLLRALRRRNFDIAIQPTHSRGFLEGDSLIRASGARERIGSSGDWSCISPKQKTISDRWYTRLLVASSRRMHELARNAEFMRHLGMEGFDPAIPKLPSVAALPSNLKMAGPYLVLFPGASWSGRQWAPHNFAAIADRLYKRMGLRAVICGSAKEFELCHQIAELANVDVLNLAGETSLPHLVEIVRHARLLISNETSAIHIAAAVETPAVCILGGGHYGRFLPYDIETRGATAPTAVLHRMTCFGCNWICSQPHRPDGPVPCVDAISLQAVLLAAELAAVPMAETSRA